MRTRLSICIATFNRGSFIGETLESIIPQMTNECELVILDGGSRDNTEEVVQAFRARCPRLRYVRQDKNLGVDQDFNRSVELADGDYCWLMTDDDLLKEGAVARVLSAIRDGHALVVVNAEVLNADLSDVVDSARLTFREDRQYGPGDTDRLFAEVADFLSFIGCVVIRRDMWMARAREPYFGSLFIHVGVIFQQPLQGTALVIGRPLVSIRYGNAMWTPRTFEIWTFKWPELVWSFKHISDAAKAKVIPREPWQSAATLVKMRATGAYSRQEYRRWIESRQTSRLRRGVAYAVALAPGRLTNLVVYVLAYAFYKRSRLPLLDLRASRFSSARLADLFLRPLAPRRFIRTRAQE